MHWTLQVLIGLCVVAAALNLAAFILVGQVRTCGVLICAAWALQQMAWLGGEDPFVLAVICDGLFLIWAFSRVRAPDAIECIVAMSIPVTAFCYSWQHFCGSVHILWWANWYAVAFQMVLGLPWPQFQKALFAYSHGSSKRPKEA